MSVDRYNNGDPVDRPFHPSKRFAAVTPSDTVNFSELPVGIYVGAFGDVVAVTRVDGVAVTFKNVPAGTILPVRPLRINSTNTTATNLVALF